MKNKTKSCNHQADACFKHLCKLWENANQKQKLAIIEIKGMINDNKYCDKCGSKL